jgi:RNA polymerase sigma-70 factor (sigma-E family)
VELQPIPMAARSVGSLYVSAADDETATVETSAHRGAAAFEIQVVALRTFETFEAFVVMHGPLLTRCAFLIVGDAGAAQDVVQIALAKVSRRWPTIIEAGPPLPYVRTAVVRTAISWRRRRWHGEVPTAAIPERADADVLLAVDQRDRLRRGLAALPPRQRAAVVLRHYLDLDERAAATALGCSIGTIKSQTAKGLERLRAALESVP